MPSLIGRCRPRLRSPLDREKITGRQPDNRDQPSTIRGEAQGSTRLDVEGIVVDRANRTQRAVRPCGGFRRCTAVRRPCRPCRYTTHVELQRNAVSCNWSASLKPLHANVFGSVSAVVLQGFWLFFTSGRMPATAPGRRRASCSRPARRLLRTPCGRMAPSGAHRDRCALVRAGNYRTESHPSTWR
jgi:hypothetical protein